MIAFQHFTVCFEQTVVGSEGGFVVCQRSSIFCEDLTIHRDGGRVPLKDGMVISKRFGIFINSDGVCDEDFLVLFDGGENCFRHNFVFLMI